MHIGKIVKDSLLLFWKDVKDGIVIDGITLVGINYGKQAKNIFV